jgi:hypothetical protein
MEQYLVYFEDIVITAGDKVFDDYVKLSAGGESVSRPL